MTFRSPPTSIGATDALSATGGAANPAVHQFADLPAPAAMDPPTRPPTRRATHRAAHQVSRGAGTAGRARHRSGVRPGGAAGTSPGTTSGAARPGRRRRTVRGADAAISAASRLRADALMTVDRPAAAASTTASTPAGAARACTSAATTGEPGRARAAPSWAADPLPSPTPDAGATAAPAAWAALPPRHGDPDGSVVRPRGWREFGPALRDRLPLWVRSRCGLEPRALAALAVVLVGAAVLACTHFWSARPEPVRAPDRVTEAAAAVQAGEPEPSNAPPHGPSTGSKAGAAPGGQIVVDVSGKVRRPGIQYLPSGSRVADALRAAGGVREGTDVTVLNRARVLTDGEQVAVGMPPAPPPVGGAGAGGSAGGQAGPAAPLSLGTATVEQLDTLPGVGPVLAQHIIDYRTEHGGYRSVDELREVNGIGDRRFADLRPLVRP
ncbi:ComEA family DNA-binding protein [Streptomyces sp. HB132]|uniref:ComEA family DNA-binding protein n=1 Tax=Streptomyces sp. HB132 TaxID=767388 RepID=UPI001D5E2EC3|nr:ComEA family DNA-binding protein [Streptomyces sp. HB132]MBM7439205.1 comEA protein [Streptomyces sp. HB132]